MIGPRDTAALLAVTLAACGVDGRPADPDPADAAASSDAAQLDVPDAGDDGEVVTLRIPVAIDTMLREDAQSTTGGAREDLDVDADPWRVSLLRFDLTAIPSNATVLAASIDTTVFNPIESGTMQLYPLTESWSESEATFLQRQAGVAWSSPGADVPSRDESRLVGELAPRANGLTSFTLDVDIVQVWVLAPAQNKGVIMVSTSPDGRGAQLRSSEYPVVAERPYLDVTYRLP